MTIKRSASATFQISNIKGPIKKYDKYKDVFKARYGLLHVKNGADKGLGQEGHNSIIVYYPFICIITDESMVSLLSNTYGMYSLGTCIFAYYNQVAGKRVPSIAVEFEDCIATFTCEISTTTFSQINTAHIIQALEDDEGYAKPNNLERYLNTLSRAKNITYGVRYRDKDVTNYAFIAMTFSVIRMSCKEIGIDGNVKGNSACEIQCLD